MTGYYPAPGRAAPFGQLVRPPAPATSPIAVLKPAEADPGRTFTEPELGQCPLRFSDCLVLT